MASPNVDDVFGTVNELKADAAVELGLDTEERIAAVSPGPGFPTVLRSLADAVPSGPERLIVDLGAGVGGASTWLAAETGAQVVAIEPVEGARAAAQRLFPELDIRPGTAEESGLPTGIADAVVLLGVISLLDDLGAVFAEAGRVLRPEGVLGVADMFLAEPGDGSGIEQDGMNTLRTMAATVEQLDAAGYDVINVGCANDAHADEEWARVAEQVNERLRTRHGDDPALEPWLADQQQLSAWIDGGHVHGGCIVARRRD